MKRNSSYHFTQSFKIRQEFPTMLVKEVNFNMAFEVFALF